MLKTKKNYLKWIIISLTIFVTIFTNIRMSSDAATLQYTQEQYDTLIRFGITAPLGVVGYDLSEIHALTYLDWAKESLSVPDGVEYIHVLKMRFNKDDSLDQILFDQFLQDLPNLIARNIGSTWLIGNEPDCYWQDNLFPEIYAERFFAVTNIINSEDETALVGFGSIVQPTPIRLRYLERSLKKLEELSGSKENAMKMIDFWSIHSFILNEEPITDTQKPWGAGHAIGFDCSADDCFDLIIITDYADTYSIDIFEQRISNFRMWMEIIGEREKPLWITEYGSLLPDWEVYCSDPVWCEPYNNWPSTKDNINFLVDSFDFLLNTSNGATGLPNDENKLVQRWYWYSLNDHLDSFGGSLFDPDNDKQITELGKAYKRYIEFLIFPKTFLPIIFK